MFSLWFGYGDFLISPQDGARFFEMCRAAGLTPAKVRPRPDGALAVRFAAWQFTRVRAMAAAAGVAVVPLRQGGLPALLRRLIRRPGIVAGALLALAVFFASPLFLWDVEVTGSEAVPEAELRAELRAVGLCEGAFLSRIDPDAVAIALRRADERVAYVSVNLRGTVAEVQIRDAEPEPPATPTAPANLVAARDGVVILPLIFEGVCLVREGDAVRAGDILAGGLTETENNGLRVTRAAGEVLARTVRTYEVRVPFQYEEKVYTGRHSYNVSLSFFGFEGKIFETTGKEDITCDIIKTEKRFGASLLRALPVGIVSETAVEYEMRPARRTAKEALQLAKTELEARLAADAPTRTMLSRSVETRVDEAGITLICTVVAEENIAVVSEIALR